MMSKYAQRIGTTNYRFDDLRSVMAAASSSRSGDELAGVAAGGNEERVAARMVLADTPLRNMIEEPLIPYESDEVTRLIVDTHDQVAFAQVAGLTVGEFRDWLLSEEADEIVLRELSPGLTPEIVAAASKLMSNLELIAVARKCRPVTRFRTTLGLPGRISSRLQPNHPTDDARAVLAATIDGLLFGMGDAVVGINPASDNLDACVILMRMLDDLRITYEIPMQSCILTHVTTSIAAVERKAPIDLVFQSIAGSEKANAAFGVNLAVLQEGKEAAESLGRGTHGGQVMYFETGQGSALSSSAHFDIDQQTMEARAYAVARAFDPLLVNTVVGFIGPEYLYNGKQIARAGLEDHFCGKMLGLPMGADVCYTNHAEADQDDMDNLAVLLATARAHFLIAIPGGDDIMLNYQSLSYHDIAQLRHVMDLKPAPEFVAWLEKMGIERGSGSLLHGAGGDARLEQLVAGYGS
jgi:ethanolamine ammonia-lyase large subunit